MTQRSFSQDPEIVPFLYLLSQLELKVSAVTKTEPLIFTIVNDTVHLVPYDRAYLFKMDEQERKLIGISGQTKVNEIAPLAIQLDSAMQGLLKPEEAGMLHEARFSSDKVGAWQNLQQEQRAAVYWLPIYYDKKLVLGLWLEQWGVETFSFPVPGIEVLARDFLLPAYGIAWNRLEGKVSLQKWLFGARSKAAYWAVGILLVLFLVRIPLRVVAPCEIVTSDPYYVRAPLEGVIKEILVKPGQHVRDGDLLFDYESTIHEEAYRSAQQQLLAKKLELERAAIMGLHDEQQQNQIAILKAEMQKEAANLGLMAYQVGLTSIKTPVSGVVVLESDSEWRGKPVKVGEKVLVISDPAHTKVKIWIPESDNVPLDLNKDIKVFLNITPSTSYRARIDYIANEVSMSDKDIPSFISEANWVGEPPADIKLGLKGTAVLYGESVSLFYYVMRRPWYALRNFVGF